MLSVFPMHQGQSSFFFLLVAQKGPVRKTEVRNTNLLRLFCVSVCQVLVYIILLHLHKGKTKEVLFLTPYSQTRLQELTSLTKVTPVVSFKAEDSASDFPDAKALFLLSSLATGE